MAIGLITDEQAPDEKYEVRSTVVVIGLVVVVIEQEWGLGR